MRFLLSLLLVGVCWGQRTDTIYQRVITRDVVVAATVRNIGQSQHLLTVVVNDDAPGVPCLTAIDYVDIRLEASWNGTEYFRVSPPNVAMQYALTPLGFPVVPYHGTMLAFGAYPYLRVVQGALYGGCPINVDYAGTIPVGGYGQIKASLTGFNNATGAFLVGGQFPIVNFTFAATSRIIPYAIMVREASGAANDILVYYENVAGSACAAVPAVGILQAVQLQAYNHVMLGPGLLPLSQGAPGMSLCIQAANATLVEWTVIYRIE